MSRITAYVATLGGLLWTVKALVIALRGGSFDPLEGVFFIGGILAFIVAGALAGYQLRRVLGAIAGVLVAFAVTLAIESIGSSVFSGLEGEAGVLLAGLVWLAVGLTQLSRSSRSSSGRTAVHASSRRRPVGS